LLPERLWELGKADIYEVCRLSNFHTLIFQDRKHGHDSNVPKNAPLWEAISITVESSQKTGGNNAKQKKDKLMDRVIEHCVEMEFLNYWNLLSQQEKDELAEVGITNYKQNYRTQMAKAQTAYHNIFTSGEFACFVLVVLRYCRTDGPPSVLQYRNTYPTSHISFSCCYSYPFP